MLLSVIVVSLFIMCIVSAKEKFVCNEQMKVSFEGVFDHNEYISDNKSSTVFHEQVDNTNNKDNENIDYNLLNKNQEIIVSNEQEDVIQYIINLNNSLERGQISVNEGYTLIEDLFLIDKNLYDLKFVNNLKTGWIRVENNKIDEYTFYFNNCMVSRIRYFEYVDETQNILYSDYAESSEIIKKYKYEEEYRVVGSEGLDYTVSQNYNTIDYNEVTDRYEYTGEMKYYNIQDYASFGDPSDYGICSNMDCAGCLECIEDWTRCIKKATEDALITGGVVYFPTNEYLVDLDDDSGLEYEILPNGTKSSFDKTRTKNGKGRGIFLSGNYITYKDNTVDIPKGFAPIIFDLCGSKIKLEKNRIPNYSVIEVRNCKYFEIKNGVVQGDRMEHDYSDFLYDGVHITTQSGDAGNHTQGYGIKIQSTEKGIVSNINVYDATADALCFNNAVAWNADDTCIGNDTNIEVKYTYAHHSRRQGITVGDINSINIHHCEIAYIGGGNRLNSDGSYSLRFGWASEEDKQKYDFKLTDEERNIVGTLGVGRNPMAGIDFEPDRGTFQVKKAIVNNCYIHTTDGFSIVGVGSSSSHHTTSEMLITNSFIDGFICLSEEQDEYINDVFYPAEEIMLKNNIILYSDPVVQRGYVLDENLQGKIETWTALQTTNINYTQCIIRKTYKGYLSVFGVGNSYIDCLIEQEKDALIYLDNVQNNTTTPNGYFRFTENCNIINTTFRNMIGAQVNGSYWYAYGIIFVHNGLGYNYGNTFENCSIMLNDVTLGNSNNSSIIDTRKATNFIDGIVYIYSNKTTLNNCSFVNSITNASTRYLELNYCVLLNTQSIFGDKNGDAFASRYINNCYFQFDSESMFASRLNRGSHWGGIWKNSILRIENDVKVSNRICKYTDENKQHPHFTFMSMTDLDDNELTIISLNENMQTKASLLYRNNEYNTKENCHSGSHNYEGLCFYEKNKWLDFVKSQVDSNDNLIYQLAYNTMIKNGYYE